MSFKPFFRSFAPLAATALGMAIAGCSNAGGYGMSSSSGVPLSELDMSGDAPTRLSLAGSDRVILQRGERLAIEVEGDPDVRELLRFDRRGDKLEISRERSMTSTKGRATIRVTMASPVSIAVAGSGAVETDELASEAELSIAGSGSVAARNLRAEQLGVSIAGSGEVMADGTARSLKLNIAGSGDARLDRLEVDDADINIMGSGNGSFSSDGTVKASIAGSGDVRVYGRARCTVSAAGSGTLTCAERTSAAKKAEPDENS
ncbi:head GIN domain-containing protein [Parapontixanthobacter aurantiacus]|nr:head GIN domain-containing protein [Parapontixanthobacter aurantiacus]